MRLPALELPSGSAPLTAAEALGYSAIQLFNDRVEAAIDGFVLSDAEVPAVLEICRRLDGTPLALELAAAQVAVFGIRGLAALLDDRLAVLSRGWRTALPRHQTLRAAIDWSYHPLSAIEQTVFRRLGVFRGSFTVEAAAGVAADGRITAADVIESVASLAEKSLVATDVSGDITHFRLLETTRSYAHDKLADSGEAEETARRHAEFLRAALGLAHLRISQHPQDDAREILKPVYDGLTAGVESKDLRQVKGVSRQLHSAPSAKITAPSLPKAHVAASRRRSTGFRCDALARC
jgi:predicted ATPase